MIETILQMLSVQPLILDHIVESWAGEKQPPDQEIQDCLNNLALDNKVFQSNETAIGYMGRRQCLWCVVK